MKNDLIVILIVFFYILLVYSLPIFFYKKKKLKKIHARNIIHFFSGLSIISLFFAQNKWLYLIASLIITFIIFLARKKTIILKHVYESLAHEEEKNYLHGPFIYGLAISYLILFSIIFNNNLIPLASTLILTISDPLACVIGKKYGTIIIPYLKNKRTIKGSLGMFFSSAIILLFFYGFSIKIIGISLILTIVELISPSKIDDFTLPLTCSILMLN